MSTDRVVSGGGGEAGVDVNSTPTSHGRTQPLWPTVDKSRHGPVALASSGAAGSIAPDAARLWARSMEKDVGVSRGISILFRREGGNYLKNPKRQDHRLKSSCL